FWAGSCPVLVLLWDENVIELRVTKAGRHQHWRRERLRLLQLEGDSVSVGVAAMTKEGSCIVSGEGIEEMVAVGEGNAGDEGGCNIDDGSDC
ncbi:hypothetical protein B296_00048332, partial [Ensete ventricosum]